MIREREVRRVTLIASKARVDLVSVKGHAEDPSIDGVLLFESRTLNTICSLSALSAQIPALSSSQLADRSCSHAVETKGVNRLNRRALHFATVLSCTMPYSLPADHELRHQCIFGGSCGVYDLCYRWLALGNDEVS